jgi:hypothetical protein
MSIMVFGMFNFCFANFSMSDKFTLSARANKQSFSMSDALADLVSGQKKMLPPDGVSGKSQKKSQFHKLLIYNDPGWKEILSDCRRCRIISFALNWLFLARKVIKNSVG